MQPKPVIAKELVGVLISSKSLKKKNSAAIVKAAPKAKSAREAHLIFANSNLFRFIYSKVHKSASANNGPAEC